MSRTIVIGDIHGGFKALQQLIGRVSPQENDRLVFLGDYVDGWSESAHVIERLIHLEASHDCIFIKGNHDIWCEEWLAGGKPNREWLFHGGKETIESYGNFDQQQKKTHLEFFNRLKDYYTDEQNRLYIHAGFTSMHGPAKEHYASNFNTDRTLWEMARTMDQRISKDSKLYPKRLLHYKEIFIGHTPTVYYDTTVPMNGCNVWNVDTGAAFTGPVSAIDADTKQFWQSDIVQILYPNEKGRNK
ncbi:MAG: serine/threonine protein phosphatase [Citrobacter freundii]|nr:MAG: serine/threonine protein phosphatase [Citrobacter freundii]